MKDCKEMPVDMKAKKDVLLALRELASKMIADDMGGEEGEPKAVMAELKMKKLKPEGGLEGLHDEELVEDSEDIADLGQEAAIEGEESEEDLDRQIAELMEKKKKLSLG